MSSQFERLSKVLAKSFNLNEETLKGSFHLATMSDIDTVSELRHRVFGDYIKQNDRDYLQWRYFGRNAYESTLWVFEYKGKVIAAIGTEPVEIWYEDHFEAALKNMDAIVEPIYDNRGLGAWMTMAIQQQNNCVLVVGGNENSTSMLNKLFTPLPVRKNYKIILKTRDYLTQKLKKNFISALLSPLFNLSVDIYLNVRWLLNSETTPFSLHYYNNIAELIPQISEPIGCIGQIKVVRSQEYLKWRYAENTFHDYLAAGITDQGKLIAYMIYKYEDGWGTGSTRMGQIIDWYVITSGDSLNILTSLFITSIKDLKKRNCDEVMLVLNDALSHQAATAAGFVFRYVESKFFVYHIDSEQNSSLFSKDSWYQSLGDTDTV